MCIVSTINIYHLYIVMYIVECDVMCDDGLMVSFHKCDRRCEYGMTGYAIFSLKKEEILNRLQV